jgi:probable rRNA maturation factor
LDYCSTCFAKGHPLRQRFGGEASNGLWVFKKNLKTRQMEIEIFQIDPAINLSEDQIKNIIQNTCNKIGLKAKSCHFIFVDDPTLAEMHGQYLNDPTPTDVITFDLGDDEVEGEIYISIDRAQAQAKAFNASYKEEITRLIVHGLLHLAGYDDIEESDRVKMKEVENRLVEIFSQLYGR